MERFRWGKWLFFIRLLISDWLGSCGSFRQPSSSWMRYMYWGRIAYQRLLRWCSKFSNSFLYLIFQCWGNCWAETGHWLQCCWLSIKLNGSDLLDLWYSSNWSFCWHWHTLTWYFPWHHQGFSDYSFSLPSFLDTYSFRFLWDWLYLGYRWCWSRLDWGIYRQLLCCQCCICMLWYFLRPVRSSAWVYLYGSISIKLLLIF